MAMACPSSMPSAKVSLTILLLRCGSSDRRIRSALQSAQLIGATTTETGLKVECILDERIYEKGKKISDAEMAALNITGDAFHPEWNYTIKPRCQRTM
jgi:hypothetical protein